MSDIIMKIQGILTQYGIMIIAALAILILGRIFAKIIRRFVQRLMRKSKIDETVVTFTGNLVYIALMIFIILAALSELGVQTTSFIAVIGAAGLAIGLALQGALTNFAAGVLMIIFRPFKVGDYIEGGGTAGIVEEIQVFTTILKSPDNKLVIVPNGALMNGVITNYTAKDTRRIDLVYGVSYSDDLDKTRKVIEQVLAAETRILPEPALTIGLLELGDSSVNFAVRPWVKPADYWNVLFALNEAMKKAFDENGISIPFPQRDVHFYEEKKS